MPCRPRYRPIRRGLCARRASGWSGLRRLGCEQSLADLAQRDRKGLLLDARLHERADVLKQALAELGVVGVDLPRALGRHDNQAVLAVHDLKQIVNRRVDDALYRWSPCHLAPSRSGSKLFPGSALACWASTKATS